MPERDDSLLAAEAVLVAERTERSRADYSHLSERFDKWSRPKWPPIQIGWSVVVEIGIEVYFGTVNSVQVLLQPVAITESPEKHHGHLKIQ